MDEQDLKAFIGEAPTPAPAPPRHFKPWHRPRKQYVRLKQWRLMLHELLSELGKKGHPQVVQYLGLPGEDLLDIRVFHDVIAELGNSWRLQYLAFNATATSEEVLSESMTHDLPQLQSERCQYLRHSLDSVVSEDGPGGKALRQYGGFDVVNLDLCEAIMPPRSDGMVRALRAIIKHQVMRRADPWLLFLTTRVDSPSLDRSAQTAFIECIRRNAASSDEFHDLLYTELSLNQTSIAEILGQLQAPNGRNMEFSPPTIGLGIAKWILCLLESEPWVVRAGPCYMYSIGDQAPNMAAVALRFERHPPVLNDTTGLIQNSPSPQVPSESAVACKLVKPIARMRNVDELLQRDHNIRREFTESSAELLVRAGHKKDAYLWWALQQSS